MKIELHEIPIRDVVNGYMDSDEEGVIGYGGKLNIRPKYQREFVYKDQQRDAVIDTVTKNFPLNVMYWVKNEDGLFEVLDGQQRTLSLCKYVKGDFSFNQLGFHNLTNDKQAQFLNYKLMVYICEGTDSEKLDWFKIINIAGEKLTDQELRNAVYTGLWLTDAKRHFSKTQCAAYGLAKDYMNGDCIRQGYLERVLDWISRGNIEKYMAEHQHSPNASEIWQYFQFVISWVKTIFPKYRKEMKIVDWGRLYNLYHDKLYDSQKLDHEIAVLMQDDDVTKKTGIYEYLLSQDEKYLNIRAFTDAMKREAFEKQIGICTHCKKTFTLEEMETDHITPWHAGGKTNAENCQMLCKGCNRRKSGK